jgi:hypothetical protein
MVTQSAAPRPIACDLSVFSGAQRQRLKELVERVFAACSDVHEIHDGYLFQFAGETSSMIAEWIALELLCCPFISFTLGSSRGEDPLYLRVTGGEGVKQFVLAKFVGREQGIESRIGNP